MKALFGFLGLVLTAALSRSFQAAGLRAECTNMRTQIPIPLSVYLIQPAGSQTRFKVACHHYRTHGWIVIQRRTGAYVYFERTWDEYKNGFGSLTYDHWLGLEKVHILTNDTNKVWTLRVDLWDYEGGRGFALYRDFRIGDEGTNYRLHVGNYSGNAGDAIRGSYPGGDQNGAGFSTFDRPNNKCPRCFREDEDLFICAVNCCSTSGGWWNRGCGSTILNGYWHFEDDAIGWDSGVHWPTWKPVYEFLTGKPVHRSMKACRMMIRSDG